MALKLRVPIKFMNSEHLPEVCLYSGRTDSVAEKSRTLDYVHPVILVIVVILILTLIAVLPALLIYSIARRSVSITTPQAPWERFKWALPRQLAGVALVVPSIAGCMLSAMLLPRGSDWQAVVSVGGLVVGLVTAIGLTVWAWQAQVGLRVVDMDTVQLRFPDRMKATHDHYREAYELWQQDAAARRRRPGAGDDEEDWVGDNRGTWDQSQPPA